MTGWNEVGGGTEAGIKVGWNLPALVAERLRVRLTIAMKAYCGAAVNSVSGGWRYRDWLRRSLGWKWLVQIRLE